MNSAASFLNKEISLAMVVVRKNSQGRWREIKHRKRFLKKFESCEAVVSILALCK
jgi:hypothetical protein